MSFTHLLTYENLESSDNHDDEDDDVWDDEND